MRLFRKNEMAVSPVIGVILMVAITVILAAVIAAFVFGIGGQQAAAPTASIVAANNPDTTAIDMKIQHKGGDTLKGGEWKISIVKAGEAPSYVTSLPGNDLSVGAQLTTKNQSDGVPVFVPLVATDGLFATNYTVAFGQYDTTTYTPTYADLVAAGGLEMLSGQKYDVKLVHIPSNAMLLDTVVEVR
jgi:flagellin-like protein